MDSMEIAQFASYAGRQGNQDAVENAELTHVGPGTPCGEYLRTFLATG